MGKLTLTHPALHSFLRNPFQKFDVVIAEWIDSEIYSGFASFFGCPLIWSLSTQLYWQPMRIMDEISNPSYTADIASGYLPPLHFGRRLRELYIQTRKTWILHNTILPLEENLYKSVFVSAALSLGMKLKPYSEIPNNYSMMLVNSHPSVAVSWRIPPSVKEIAGYHIKLPPDNLNSELQYIMDTSPQGVIYFSMGTGKHLEYLDDKILEDILKIFANLRLTVIWKIEKELKNIPKNVHILKWAPQTSILSHKHTKLFISHGGMLSLIETIHFGIPIIAIPRDYDQFNNVEAAVKKGIAMKLDFNDNLPINLLNAIKILLDDIRYELSIKKVSSIYHDRIVPPASEMVHWVQHVITSSGAKYFRSPALDTPSYQKLYVDLAALIILIMFIVFFLMYFSIRWCVTKCKKCCKKNK